MNSFHPEVPYDPALIDSVASTLNLRTPNKEALDRVAVELSDTNGQAWSGICDLATAVGKTYLAAGLIDYLSQSDAGIRHFLFIVPNKTVYNKTIENFTAGTSRSLLPMMTTQPVVIHPGNFNAGWVAAEMTDPNSVKLFVFNIQQLTAPTEKASKKTRDDDNENLGTSLYTMLKELDDLVVLSDEHHLYASKAKSFSAAINDLGAMAVVGLTATPDKTQTADVIYQYPLARAIAERIVKTPCITGRTDNRSDLETRYRDAIVLLEAKKRHADQYAQAMNTHTVNPVLLVVAESIEQADEVAERLRRSDLFDSDDAVLVVHSNSNDDDLERLAEVEDPASTVRAIVSVQMLGVGWDVKNVYVILSLRPSVSEALTEQTLGRGLRLPWGSYTDNEMLDTVDVLAHEQYKKLLANTDKILEGLERDGTVDSARAAAARKRAAAKRAAKEYTKATKEADETAEDASTDTPTTAGTGKVDVVVANGGTISVDDLFILAEAQTRQENAEADADAVDKNKVIIARTDVTVNIPIVTSALAAKSLSLSKLNSEDFEDIGVRMAKGEKAALLREILNVKEEDGKYKLASKQATDSVAAAQLTIAAESVKDEIVQAVLSADFVPSTNANSNGAKRLAQAIIDGAHDEELIAEDLPTVVDLVLGKIRAAHHDLEPEVTNTAVDAVFNPVRHNYRRIETNRYAAFKTSDAYTGWDHGLYPIAWFDSATERDTANILESDPDVEVWVRLEVGDTPVAWNSGVYQPDFYVRTKDGKNWVLEVKSDKDLALETVQKKKEAAQTWANVVSDAGFGDWRYALIPQSVVDSSNTLKQMIRNKR